jgi:rare lipoprotein A
MSEATAISKFKELLYVVLFLMMMSSCSSMKYFPTGNIQTGVASWYGEEFHGKPTSNKELYNMYDMTAAHKTLPFNSYVMVTNLNNGKSVTVRINDRGPFVKNRIIDLSYAAAKMLDMIEPGTAPVRIEVLRGLSPKKSSQKFSVQVGSFTKKENALDLKKKLSRTYKNVYIAEFETAHFTYFRVRIKASTMKGAEAIAQRLTRDGYDALILEEH